ncbi:NAD(P)/FAD-dependent oxidoreductase [Arthrobacter sp. FW306-07-I]|uniref:NAD(P)/FAD-dependent oxidoreductase n=1 Tax=Arthrobacter sp. FW306-07-I TaxID=2879622 RepID=UPI001F386237|nr:FAD-dependent oxidoreductase [Arthrobacter sp. FW306-07-I]UKA76189.1 FAD-dependent oxidoreductase [Arthrobacter sp. FW306-07-I]
MSGIVIIGGGQAGVQLADSLRSEGYQGPIDLFADEPHLPYQRPPLSKDFITGDDSAEPLPLRAETFFAERGVQFHPGIRVLAIERDQQTVSTSNGRTVPYESLVFATGARNREMTIPGVDLKGIHYLRTLDDAMALQTAMTAARRVVVVGAGFIGLEFAAGARQRGLDVTVLEFAPRPMARVLSPTMSAYFAETHTCNGINMRLGEGVASFTGTDGKLTGAVGTSGTTYPADLVVIGVGVLPNSELAEQTGLDVNNGITVDSCLRTADAHIFALGDCSNYPNTHARTRLRLESVQNATDQARTLAKTLTGKPTAYKNLPWFWSQQGPIKLQIAGIIGADDETILRGTPATGNFSVYCFSGSQLTGVESVNSPADHMAARRILELGLPLMPEQVMDAEFDLKGFSKTTPLPLHEKENLEQPVATP